MKKLNYLAFAIVTILGLSSCSNDNDGPANEEEVITTVTTTLTSGVNTITLTSRDLDGDGPDAPVVTVSGPLAANSTYNGNVLFLNELASPPENISTEVAEEGDEHQVFFQAAANIGTFTYTDADVNGKPIGLSFTLQTGNAASGTLTVTLRHEPNKNASGVSEGDITNAGGATDAQVSYGISVE